MSWHHHSFRSGSHRSGSGFCWLSSLRGFVATFLEPRGRCQRMGGGGQKWKTRRMYRYYTRNGNLSWPLVWQLMSHHHRRDKGKTVHAVDNYYLVDNWQGTTGRDLPQSTGRYRAHHYYCELVSIRGGTWRYTETGTTG